MYPHGSGSRLEPGHSLSEEPTGDARKDIARAGRAQPGRCITVDRRTPIRGGDHGIAALVDDDGPGTLRRFASAIRSP